MYAYERTVNNVTERIEAPGLESLKDLTAYLNPKMAYDIEQEREELAKVKNLKENVND